MSLIHMTYVDFISKLHSNISHLASLPTSLDLYIQNTRMEVQALLAWKVQGIETDFIPTRQDGSCRVLPDLTGPKTCNGISIDIVISSLHFNTNVSHTVMGPLAR